MRQNSMFWIVTILFLETVFTGYSISWGLERPKAVSITKTSVFAPVSPEQNKSAVFCIIQNDDGTPMSFGVGFDSGMGLATYIDPAKCTDYPIYPFRITNVLLYLYHDSPNYIWPVSIQVKIKNALSANQCLGPDTLSTLYSQQFVIPEDSSYVNLARPMFLTLNPPYCVYQPFFLEIDYLSNPAATDTLPALLLDESVTPGDTCTNWGMDGGTYFKWSDFWFPPAPGDVIIRASGYTNSVDCHVRGDANGNGVIEVGDIVYLVNYLFKNGPAPDPLLVGDANCDGVVNVGDIVYLVNYLFKGGPAPSC